MAVVIAIAGGRPGMISAATGAMALLMAGMVKDHGLQYLLATTVLTGLFQVIAGALKLGSLMRFVSRSVVTGFVNALAILIFMAQLPELIGVSWMVYPMTAAGLGIIYLFPYVTKAVPSPLVAIVILTAVAIFFKLDIHRVGDMGALPDALPSFLLPNVPFNLETLRIILPTAATLAVVGLLESMMTLQIVNDMTDTRSDKNRECMGQGIANVATGFIGGMAGCAMIGQSVINVKSGGRGRLSTMIAGVVLLILVVFGAPWVRQIPMAALVAVMIMVSLSTFNWRSIQSLRTHPTMSSIVMLGTVVVTVATHDLAKGVLTGVILSAVFFARKVGKSLDVDSSLSAEGSLRTYTVTGQVFFASSDAFGEFFDFKEDGVDTVHIEVSGAHFWDLTAVGALDRVVLKFRTEGKQVEVLGMNDASAGLVGKLGTQHKAGPVPAAAGH
jgi:SulP family sulfate permease